MENRSGNGDGAAAFRSLAEVLADMPDVIERLLGAHQPEITSGHARCRACTLPGTGLPGAPWPCGLHGIATLATEIRKGRSG